MNDINPFCRIYVDSDLVFEKFVAMLANLSGVVSDFSLITTQCLDIGVQENDEYDSQKCSQKPDRWLFFKYMLEIDPVSGKLDENYISEIRKLLTSIWSNGMDAVAASEFEEMLPLNPNRKK